MQLQSEARENCIKCGEYSIIMDWSDGTRFMVSCSKGCGNRTPVYHTLSYAISIWNRNNSKSDPNKTIRGKNNLRSWKAG